MLIYRQWPKRYAIIIIRLITDMWEGIERLVKMENKFFSPFLISLFTSWSNNVSIANKCSYYNLLFSECIFVCILGQMYHPKMVILL